MTDEIALARALNNEAARIAAATRLQVLGIIAGIHAGDSTETTIAHLNALEHTLCNALTGLPRLAWPQTTKEQTR